MSDKKNIDRLFQERFKDFEVAPNDAVWSRISESLPNKKKKRRIVALWWQLGGVAAVITLLFTVGVSVFNSNKHSDQNFPIVNTEKYDSETNKQTQENLKNSKETNPSEFTVENDKLKLVDTNNESNPKQENNLRVINNSSEKLTSSNQVEQKSTTVTNQSSIKEKSKVSQKQNAIITSAIKNNSTKVANIKKSETSDLQQSKSAKITKDKEPNSVINKTIIDSKSALADNASSNKQDSKSLYSEKTKPNATDLQEALIEDSKKQSIEEALTENTNSSDKKEADKQNRWSIIPNVAPVYYSSLGQGSSLDAQFNNNSKRSDINMSYGITGSYAISNKLKVRAGINRVNLSQTTSNVFAFTGAETAARGLDAKFQNISFQNNNQTVSIMSSEMMNRSSVPEAFNTTSSGNIDQRFGFIEVPLEIEYRLLDKKFGINVIGGFSTFLLNENEVFADLEGVSTLIGKANNLNSTSFSANFGLGMDYSLSKQWNINLEPTFKYQINTFNNTSGDFRPFFVGVYTGLSFKF